VPDITNLILDSKPFLKGFVFDYSFILNLLNDTLSIEVYILKKVLKLFLLN